MTNVADFLYVSYVGDFLYLNHFADFRDRREGVNEAVNDEVVAVFKGKTTKQLQLLEEQMRKKLAGGEGIDVGMYKPVILVTSVQ